MPDARVAPSQPAVRDTGPGRASTPVAAAPPARAWLRRPSSRVALLARISAVFSQRIDGSRKWSQSPLAPWRTASALVYAADDIAIAATATQTPVVAGASRSLPRAAGVAGMV